MKMSLENQNKVIAKAMQILEHRAKYGVDKIFFSSPETVKNYFCMRHLDAKAEQFDVLFLDNRHRLIACETLFYGTIDSASVYPREVVRKALEHNAAALVISHNHPSGVAEPSRADVDITGRLKNACALVDVRILDHIITGDNCSVSLAERGEM